MNMENCEAGGNTVLRPFFFMTVFWGDEFRSYFTDYCVPSLLAPQNLPCLSDVSGNRFLICTTDSDQEIVRRSPIFEELSKHIQVQFVSMETPGPGSDRYRFMSLGDKAMTQMAHSARAYGTFIAPDAMFSNGSIATLKRLALQGKRCVYWFALRFAKEPIFAKLKERGLPRIGEPIVLSGRELCRLALDHLHPEIARCEWNSPTFTFAPISCFWRVPDGQGIVLHSHSWGPALGSYAELDTHDSSTFDTWARDGDYAYRNWGAELDERVTALSDSDEIMMVSFTPQDERPEPVVVNTTKGMALRALSYSDVMDPLRRRLMRIPVLLHGGDLTPDFQRTVAEASEVLSRELYPPRWYERIYMWYRRFGWKGFIPQSWRPWLRPFRRLFFADPPCGESGNS